MNAETLAVAATFLLIVAALWLGALYEASYGALRPEPLPRCIGAVGGGYTAWLVCR